MFCIGQHCCPNLLTDQARAKWSGMARGRPPVDLGAPDGGESSLEAARGTKVASRIGYCPFAQAVIGLGKRVAPRPGG